MAEEGSALAEGFYWMAEKLMWGHEDVERNPSEALRLYLQAAGLGWSDAHIRIGEIHEHGRAGSANAVEALASYQRAVEAGNFLAYAFIAKLLARTKHGTRSEVFWDKFFACLTRHPGPPFKAETVGGLLHAYVGTYIRV